MNKFDLRVNLGDFQDEVLRSITQKFSMKDIENWKEQALKELVNCGNYEDSNIDLLAEICNFLNAINFEEKENETTMDIKISEYKTLHLTLSELDLLYDKYIYRNIPNDFYKKNNVGVVEGLKLYKSEFTFLDFITKIENGEIKILKSNDLDDLMIQYAFNGKEKDSFDDITYTLNDIYDILKSYKKVLDNKGVEIIKCKVKGIPTFYIMED